jgi:aminoglycoside N3'-acetyltransferase
VHTSFLKVRPVEDGPMGLIAALRIAVGPQGTLVMPSMTSDDDHPFDPKTTPCMDMGIVADTFGDLRAFCAATTRPPLPLSGPKQPALLLLIPSTLRTG